MSARKIQDETEARECIAKMKESGLTLAQWARSAGIDGRSLHAWNVNLARGGSGLRPRATDARGTHRVKLVELVPMAARSTSAPYVVRVGQFAIEVDVRFDEATLRRLIAVLRAC
ncbi:MAG: hypothetical protein QM784_25665 [Polyangiaceae bacterium]